MASLRCKSFHARLLVLGWVFCWFVGWSGRWVDGWLVFCFIVWEDEGQLLVVNSLVDGFPGRMVLWLAA